MLVTVVEELYHTLAAKALYLAFKWIYSLRMDYAHIRQLKSVASVLQVLVGLDLVLLIRAVIIEHTDPDRNDGPVCFVLAYHIDVPVLRYTHNNAHIRLLPVKAL